MAKDNELFAALVTIMNAGLVARGRSGIGVRQSYQPTQQGTPRAPTIFLHKIGDRRYGYLKRVSAYNNQPLDPKIIHIETQFMETRFQVNALAIQDPAVLNSLTASDIVNIASSIMQSDATRAALKALGIGILRVTELQNPYFIDDKERYEASPSFDFILTHEHADVSEEPIVVSVEYQIKLV